MSVATTALPKTLFKGWRHASTHSSKAVCRTVPIQRLIQELRGGIIRFWSCRGYRARGVRVDGGVRDDRGVRDDIRDDGEVAGVKGAAGVRRVAGIKGGHCPTYGHR